MRVRRSGRERGDGEEGRRREDLLCGVECWATSATWAGWACRTRRETKSDGREAPSSPGTCSVVARDRATAQPRDRCAQTEQGVRAVPGGRDLAGGRMTDRRRGEGMAYMQQRAMESTRERRVRRDEACGLKWPGERQGWVGQLASAGASNWQGRAPRARARWRRKAARMAAAAQRQAGPIQRGAGAAAALACPRATVLACAAPAGVEEPTRRVLSAGEPPRGQVQYRGTGRGWRVGGVARAWARGLASARAHALTRSRAHGPTRRAADAAGRATHRAGRRDSARSSLAVQPAVALGLVL